MKEVFPIVAIFDRPKRGSKQCPTGLPNKDRQVTTGQENVA